MSPDLNPIAILAAIAIGWWLKNRSGVNNQAIPILNFAVLFLSRVLLEAGEAHAGVFGVLKSMGAGLGAMAYDSAVSAIVASGAQSSMKATGRAFKNEVLLRVVAKLLQKAKVE